MSHADRLQFVLNREGVTQTQLAESLDYAPSYINNILRGRKPMSEHCARKLSDAFGLSVDWLLHGKGEPYGSSGAPGATTTATSTTTEEPVVGPEADIVYRPHCGECGARVSEGLRRCHNCGAWLTWPPKSG
jgi:hypothetical protein